MFSKLKRVISISVLSCLTLSACDTKIGEKPPEESVQEFSGAQCLTEAGPVFGRFFESTATKNELDKSWDCVVSALDKFKKYVHTVFDNYRIKLATPNIPIFAWKPMVFVIGTVGVFYLWKYLNTI